MSEVQSDRQMEMFRYLTQLLQGENLEKDQRDTLLEMWIETYKILIDAPAPPVQTNYSV